ncbi:probable inactive ribonuclease-like protein 13 isoform X2 [Tupaia chinensis]|uniref:probable inactive ribonuclease-like protein 13 isoform X2 n=1 Tax=Tupaia chinensis TaxID=246437 RepID=UPI0003C91312|nr:probable inactive ribonuclease-like protein 13 isoform X2 [Tupaia chinensis]
MISEVPFSYQKLVLGPTVVMDNRLQMAIKNFRDVNIDYPKVNYPKGFQGYCNGLMAYVRGRMKMWQCPKIHYMIHAPLKTVQKLCKYSESFCENYNKYCTLTQDSFPITVCSLVLTQPPTSCRYNSTLANQRLYLLCSGEHDAEPVDIIGVY